MFKSKETKSNNIESEQHKIQNKLCQTHDENYAIENGFSKKIVVIDVGCRWGFAENFLSQIDYFKLYGFDPDEQECLRLNEHYNSANIQAIPLGLSGENGDRVLYVTKEPACSSLLKPDEDLINRYPVLECAREVNQIIVETKTLDFWANSEGLSYIDHIKIDTQGSELEILSGGSEILKTVRSIEVEVEFNPIYLGQPLFSDIDKFLRQHGFVLWKFSNFAHYSKREIIGDSLGEDITYYDFFHQIKRPIYSGQLYWANAHYVKSSIISKKLELDTETKYRDYILFKALGMQDVMGE